MLNELLVFHPNRLYDILIKILVGTTCICFLGPMSFELEGEINLTLQTLIILFFAIGFGWRVGLFSVLLYFGVAALDLPVLGGYESLADKEIRNIGGFYFGFLAAAVICGFLSEIKGANRIIFSVGIWFLGHAIILLMGFGLLWSFIPPENAWYEELMEFFPALMIKVAIGMLLIKIIERLAINRNKVLKIDDK
jgi:biotin transporter BioY